MTTKAGEQEGSAPAEVALKYQTSILKVPIHCDGCKKKVKRVLQTTDGVFTTDIDSRLHKVTVTGNVDAETLVQKLVRSGKHAELWPEEKPEKKKNKNKNSKDEKEEKGKENGGEESKDNKDDDGDGENSLSEGEEQGGEVKVVESGAGPAGGGGGGGGGSGGGEGGKKKKKKKTKKKGQSNGTNNGQVTFTGIPSTFGPEQASMVPPSMEPILQDRHFNAYLPVQYPPFATYGMSYQPPTSENTYYASSELYLPLPSLETVVVYSDDYDQDTYHEDGGCSIM